MENRALTWYPCLFNKERGFCRAITGFELLLSYSLVSVQIKSRELQRAALLEPQLQHSFSSGSFRFLFFHIKTNPELQTIRPLSHQASIKKTCISTLFSYSLWFRDLNLWMRLKLELLGWGRVGKPDGNYMSFASFGNPGYSTIKSALASIYVNYETS